MFKCFMVDFYKHIHRDITAWILLLIDDRIYSVSSLRFDVK